MFSNGLVIEMEVCCNFVVFSVDIFIRYVQIKIAADYEESFPAIPFPMGGDCIYNSIVEPHWSRYPTAIQRLQSIDS